MAVMMVRTQPAWRRKTGREDLQVPVLIDTGLAVLLAEFTWRVNYKGYVRAIPTTGQVVTLARLLMNAPVGRTVDHVSGDTFDNRRNNLRVCSNSENCRNRPKQVPQHGITRRISVFKGVSWDDTHSHSTNPWRARIRVHGRQRELGRFGSEFAAAMAYNDAALRLHGEFARLNTIS